MPNIVYTFATKTHIDELINFRIKFLIEFGGPQPQELQDKLAAELRIYFSNHLNKHSYICWFASVGNKVVGIGGMKLNDFPGGFKNLDGKRGYIMNMYTLPDFRKMGICSTILQKLMGTANELGIYSFELHATKEGEPVYVKNGFEKHNEPTYRKWDKMHNE